jgi:ABC-2 type transport system ATP-binding protein
VGVLIELEGVGRRYGQRDVLKDVSVTVSSGELLGVIGPNGGGKSTLLMVMAGLVRPSAGRAVVCGVSAERLALESAGKVGLVLARPGLYPLLTGWENLVYFSGLFGMGEDAARQAAEPLLARYGLVAHMHNSVSSWSTGMQQKLSLVRALMLKPDVLLFDEPAANLDPLAADLMYRELRTRADEGMACVLVTHDLGAVESFCDKVVLVDGGIRRAMDLGRGGAPSGELLDVWREVLA